MTALCRQAVERACCQHCHHRHLYTPTRVTDHTNDVVWAVQGFVEVYRGPERSFKVAKLQPGVRYTSRVQVGPKWAAFACGD